jgi:lipopolysaccharide transport system ATP-binding protein
MAGAMTEQAAHNLSIQVNNLGKQYRIGAAQLPYHTLRESITRAAAAPFKRAASLLRGQAYGASDLHETIWALKDVSFEIRRGEVVGIIGRNGAGKTTLLKILSRITEPTTGSVDLYGRVGSLLEVGTGFHPELTGRENIYLNGAILGMKRTEIERKFDEIVDFAEIAKFIDTPVKHYSSGMYVRLAFAVAAHLEPEILLVDEVLAVGDAAFQKKCLGKMGDVAQSGRTVLFVSHNMAAVRRLCQKAIYFKEGNKAFEGDTAHAIDLYIVHDEDNLKAEFPANAESPIKLRRIEILDAHSIPVEQEVESSEGFRIRVHYDVNRHIQGIHTFLRINLADGETLISTGDADKKPERLGDREPGHYIADVLIPPKLLGEGRYSITWSAGVPFQANYDVELNVLSFRVIDIETSRSLYIHNRRPGYLALDLEWNYLT